MNVWCERARVFAASRVSSWQRSPAGACARLVARHLALVTTILPRGLRGRRVQWCARLILASVAVETALAGFALLPGSWQALAGSSLTIFAPVATALMGSLLGFYLASAAIVMHQTFSGLPWPVRRLAVSDRVTVARTWALCLPIVMGLALVLLGDFGFRAGPLLALFYVVVVAISGWAFYLLMRDTFRYEELVTLAAQPLEHLSCFGAWWAAPTSVSSDSQAPTMIARSAGALDILCELLRRAPYQRPGGRHLFIAACVRSAALSYVRARHRWPFAVDAVGETAATAPAASVGHVLVPDGLAAAPDSMWFLQRASSALTHAFVAAAQVNDALGMHKMQIMLEEVVQEVAVCEYIDEALLLIDAVERATITVAAPPPAAARLPVVLLKAAALGWEAHLDTQVACIADSAALVSNAPLDGSPIGIPGPSRCRRAAAALQAERQAQRSAAAPPALVDGPKQSPPARDTGLGAEGAQVQATLQRAAAEVHRAFPLGWLARLDRQVVVAADLPAESALAIGTAGANALAIFDPALTRLPQHLYALMASEGDDPSSQAWAVDCAPARHSLITFLAGALARSAWPAAADGRDWYGAAFGATLDLTQDALRRGDPDAAEAARFATAAAFQLRERADRFAARIGLAASPLESRCALLMAVEIAGLALAYGALRNDDDLTDAVQAAWGVPAGEPAVVQSRAIAALDALDWDEQANGMLSGDSMAWFALQARWREALAEAIAAAGYARTMAPPSGAPLLIRRLDVSVPGGGYGVFPRTVAGVELVGPLSCESEQELQSRPGCRSFWSV